MSDAQLAQLAADLRQVAGRTLPASELTYGVFSGDRAALSRSVITLVRRKADGAPVAFNALALMDLRLGTRDVQVLHLGLVMVDPEERSRGLSWVLYGLTCFVLLLRGGGRPIWVSNVTQVPAVVGMVADTFAQVYPAPQATANRPGRRSLTHLLLARQIMADHRHVFGVGADAGFDEDRFVITNAYTGGSDALKKRFDQATPHRDPAYNDFCAGMLDYDRGDDLLQLGQVDLPTALVLPCARRAAPVGRGAGRGGPWHRPAAAGAACAALGRRLAPLRHPQIKGAVDDPVQLRRIHHPQRGLCHPGRTDGPARGLHLRLRHRRHGRGCGAGPGARRRRAADPRRYRPFRDVEHEPSGLRQPAHPRPAQGRSHPRRLPGDQPRGGDRGAARRLARPCRTRNSTGLRGAERHRRSGRLAAAVSHRARGGARGDRRLCRALALALCDRPRRSDARGTAALSHHRHRLERAQPRSAGAGRDGRGGIRADPFLLAPPCRSGPCGRGAGRAARPDVVCADGDDNRHADGGRGPGHRDGAQTRRRSSRLVLQPASRPRRTPAGGTAGGPCPPPCPQAPAPACRGA